VVVVDATNLVRNLYLAMQLIETKQPIVIALTMFDLAERGNLKIDIEKLSASLGVPVIPVVAKQHRGLDKLGQAVLNVILCCPLPLEGKGEGLRAGSSSPLSPVAKREGNKASTLIKRYARIERIVSDAVESVSEEKP